MKLCFDKCVNLFVLLALAFAGIFTPASAQSAKIARWYGFTRILLLTCLIGLAACGPAAPTQVPPTQPPASTATTLPSATAVPTGKPVTINRVEYAHPEALADVSWVVAHLNDTAVRIIDARVSPDSKAYQAGHIPGAVFVDVFADLCCPSKIMGPEPFAQLMGKLGIGDDTTVVVYDTDGGLWAARLWWALRYYGHEEVKMLNGGLSAWVSEGQSLETETPKVTPAVFHAEVQPQWLATIDEVKKAIGNPEVFILDALPRQNYVGDLVEYARAGHITTALSFPAPDTLDPVTRTVLMPSDLSRMLTRLGLDPQKRVITYCGGGYYGAHTAFVLYLMGFDKVSLYDGSLTEWASDSSNPMEVGP